MTIWAHVTLSGYVIPQIFTKDTTAFLMFLFSAAKGVTRRVKLFFGLVKSGPSVE